MKFERMFETESCNPVSIFQSLSGIVCKILTIIYIMVVKVEDRGLRKTEPLASKLSCPCGLSVVCAEMHLVLTTFL